MERHLSDPANLPGHMKLLMSACTSVQSSQEHIQSQLNETLTSEVLFVRTAADFRTRQKEIESRISQLEVNLASLRRKGERLDNLRSDILAVVDSNKSKLDAYEELQLQALLASTHNGAFLWRISEVQRRRQDARDERITSIYSPPFYTGRNGYKMCVRTYLSGDGVGHGTHLSIFFVLMRGEYDPLLRWPFEHKVSLILVDQNHRKHIVQTFKPSPDSTSFQRPKSDMNVASGCPQFAPLSVLDDPSYVKNDIIYIKCIVDVSTIHRV